MEILGKLKLTLEIARESGRVWGAKRIHGGKGMERVGVTLGQKYI